MELPEFEVLEEKISKICQVVNDLRNENKELSTKIGALSKQSGDFEKLKEEVKTKVKSIIGRLEFLE